MEGMQIKKLADALLSKQWHPRNPVFPVQLHDIQLLLRRAGAADRGRANLDHKRGARRHWQSPLATDHHRPPSVAARGMWLQLSTLYDSEASFSFGQSLPWR
jgi:hypothetical protein